MQLMLTGCMAQSGFPNMARYVEVGGPVVRLFKALAAGLVVDLTIASEDSLD